MLLQLFRNEQQCDRNQVYTPMILTVQQYGTLWGSLENHKDSNKYLTALGDGWRAHFAA